MSKFHDLFDQMMASIEICDVTTDETLHANINFNREDLEEYVLGLERVTVGLDQATLDALQPGDVNMLVELARGYLAEHNAEQRRRHMGPCCCPICTRTTELLTRLLAKKR